MTRLRMFAVVAALAIVAGCAAHQRRHSLTTTLETYANTLRWGNFSHAAGFVDPAYLKAHPLTPLQLQRYQQVQVVTYEASGSPVSINPTTVQQTARIGVVNRHTMRERYVIDRQTWKWDPEAKRWWLESGLPDITHQPGRP